MRPAVSSASSSVVWILLVHLQQGTHPLCALVKCRIVGLRKQTHKKALLDTEPPGTISEVGFVLSKHSPIPDLTSGHRV